MCPLPLTIKIFVLINKNERALSKNHVELEENLNSQHYPEKKKKGECQKDSTEVEVPVFVCIQLGSAALSGSMNT